MKTSYIYPKNKEHFKKLILFAKKIISLCKKNKIEPVIYGSFSHFYHTRDKNMKVNDIDMIIQKKDFSKIIKLLEKNKIKFKYYPNCYHGMDTITIRKDNLKIEIDETGSGYNILKDNNILKITKIINFYGIKVKMITLEHLEDIYRVAIRRTQDNKAKLSRRIKHLEKFLGKKD